ncbi:uncharacterized protein LOC135650672 isoform X2 [Musa acuminata AAA Group]|uniref:uncharacterized protein LOC135650672 isoform X2 n=1 Tax=Musa acuminata AAA Group TaxID=214697 RepID=UPI0031D9DC21
MEEQHHRLPKEEKKLPSSSPLSSNSSSCCRNRGRHPRSVGKSVTQEKSRPVCQTLRASLSRLHPRLMIRKRVLITRLISMITSDHWRKFILCGQEDCEFSSQLLEFLGSNLGELSLIDYDLQLNEKAIRWKTTRIQYKQPQMPAGGAHTEADVAASWENQHRKAF